MAALLIALLWPKLQQRHQRETKALLDRQQQERAAMPKLHQEERQKRAWPALKTDCARRERLAGA